jgi:hypothetical protein
MDWSIQDWGAVGEVGESLRRQSHRLFGQSDIATELGQLRHG